MRVLHIDDELAKMQGIWNYYRTALMRSLPIEERVNVDMDLIEEIPDIARIMSCRWTTNSVPHEMKIGTFASSDEDLAKKFIKECEDQLPFVILDAIHQDTGQEILESNISAIRHLIQDASTQFIIYSEFCDDLRERIRNVQNVALEDIVRVPRGWGIPGAKDLPLDHFMLSKMQAERLGDRILEWARNTEKDR